MRRTVALLIAALVGLACFSAEASIDTSDPFKVRWEPAERNLAPGSDFEFGIVIRMPEGYYLYADETLVDFVSLEGLFVEDVAYPKSVAHEDPFLKKTVQIYSGDVRIGVKGRVPLGLQAGPRDLVARVEFRGCSPTLCFRPQMREVALEVDVVAGEGAGEGAKVERTARAAPAPRSLPERLGLRKLLGINDFGVLLERGIVFTVLVVFLAGILTSLTPCVWPVLPALFIFVGIHPHRRWGQNFLSAALLVAGLILTYSALGLAAVAVGRNLGFLYQQRWFLALVVIFFVAMSLSMFGVFDLRLPRRLQARLHRLGGRGYLGSFLSGIGLGLIASPCSGPVLAALLGYVALQGSYLKGFFLLVVFGTGMGTLMVLLGAGYGELAGRLRSGPWMVWVRRGLGLILLFPAAFYMGSLLGWSSRDFAPAHRPGIEWRTDEAAALKEARRQGKPVMMEFTADWCPPCRALERKFFSRQEIVELSRKTVPLRIDATSETPEVRALIEKYRVMGWPSVLFLSPSGKPYEDLKVCAYDPTCVEEGMREAVRRAR